MRPRARLAAFAAAIVVAAPAPADAYEFWVRSRTIGQAFQLRQYKLIGPDLFLGRRRYTQTLALRIMDIGDFEADRKRSRLAEGGLTVSWQSYLRIDHDFGSYSTGRITVTERTRRDALDLIPEISETIANFDLLYGYLEVKAVDDRVSLRIGRVLADEGWGPTAVDGVAARVAVPQVPIAVSATAGLRVRASSVLGLSAYELDGTSGAGCREYVAGATPGTGTYLLIDHDRAVVNRRFSSDYETCPQRDELQPTVGATVATNELRGIGAELGYRRTWSGTADRIYADEAGTLPGTGVNEERLFARLHGDAKVGRVGVHSFANARYSLLHATLDRFDAGVRLTRGAHSIEPSVEYFFPTFDGDSIFNVFSIDPTKDARLGYRYSGAVRAAVNGWVRRYEPIQGAPDYAGGGDASLERAFGPRARGRIEALYDTGYGGRRVGGSAEAGWRAKPNLWLRGRALVLGIDPDTDEAKYIATSGVASTTWKLSDGFAVHGIAEVDHDPTYGLQTRAIAILDFNFIPEP